MPPGSESPGKSIASRHIPAGGLAPHERRRDVGRKLLLAALLGSAAAALPALQGLSGDAARELRSLAAGVVGLVLGGALAASAGRRTFAPAGAFPWLDLVMLALVVTVVHLPVWLIGADLGLTRELSAQLQSIAGWRRPVGLPLLFAASLLVSGAVGRLTAAFERPLTRSLLALTGLALLCAALAATAVSLLSAHDAIDGRERTTKILALGVVSALAIAAAGRSTPAAIRLARFGFILCAAAGASSVFALAYVTPSPRDLAGLELEVEFAGGTIVAGPLRGRTDLHGVFVLPPGGRRLELVEVRPGPADLYEYRPPQPVDGGFARRVGDGDESSIYSDAVDRERGRGEVRIRSRRFPFLDRPSGFTLEDDVVSWAIAPSASYLVAIRQIRPPSTPPGSLGYTTAARLPRYRLELRMHGTGTEPRVLLDDQRSSLRVIAIDNRSFRVLRKGSDLGLASHPLPVDPSRRRASGSVGGYSFATSYALRPQYLAIDTFELATGRWIEGPRSSFSVAQELGILAGGREALAVCSAASLGHHQAGFCRIDLETLELRGRTGAMSNAGNAIHGKALPLSGDRLGVRWYLGGNPSRPRRDWRFTTFAPAGRELATVRIGEGDFFIPSRELEDGTLAIARSPEPAPPLRHQVFGWTLESLDLVTGARRTIAREVAPARIRHDETPDLFLTRDGRIVLPTATGLHDVTRGPRREVPAPPSTGLTSTTTRTASRQTS